MRRIAIFGIILCCLGVLPVASADLAYEAVHIGALAGGQSWALGVNGKRAVVGCSIDANGRHRAFLWTEDGGMVDLGTLGGDNSSATAINEDGEIVGWAETADGARRAFLRTLEPVMADLGVLPGDSMSEATSVADFVVGWSAAETGECHAFSWNVDLGLTLLAELEPGADTQALDVNKRGEAVGWARDSDGKARAVCWRSDGTISLQDAGAWGSAESAARSINDAGVIVGDGSDGSGQVHAFCWIPQSGLHRLPLPKRAIGARATSVNNLNRIAGYLLGKRKRAIVWDLGSDLTGEIAVQFAELPLLKGTVDSEAAAISDEGIVVGWCTTPQGEKRAVLWRPAKKKPGLSIALVGGVFYPLDSSTRDRFADTWWRVALKPFEREKRTWPYFSPELSALRFSGTTDVRLYGLSFGVEKGFEPRASVQPYVSLRVGPYWGRMQNSLTAERDRHTGLNVNASYGLIFNRNFYTELRYDYFSRFAGVDFSALSLTIGFRLFDLRR